MREVQVMQKHSFSSFVVDKGPKLLPASVKVLEQVLLMQAANSCLEIWSI